MLRQAIQRAHYQAMIWCHDTEANQILPPPDSYGWRKVGSILESIVSYLKTVPDSLIELISCRWGTGKCKGFNCSCRRAGLSCTEMCIYEGLEDSCLNT